MASIDEVSSNDINGLFTDFFDSEKTEWNGKEVVDFTTKDINPSSFHQLFLEKVTPLIEEISNENNRQKNAEKMNCSFLNQSALAFFQANDGEKIIDAGGRVQGGFKAEWGGNDGPKVSGYLEATYENDRGEDVRVRAERDSNGRGSIEISGGKGNQHA